MGLETGTYIDSLVVTNPVSTDDIQQGDNHIRLLKSTIKNTFPSLTGAVTATQAELNTLDGITSTTAELNKLNTFTGTLAGVSTVVQSTDDTITNIISLTQAAYDGIGTKDATTLYVIVG